MDSGLKILLTGATGLVGEGVLLACLEHPGVAEVLVVGRRSCNRQHPKLREFLTPDFLALTGEEPQLVGYDACFYCAGITSRGMSEAAYTRITYDTALHFAQVVLRANPSLVFCHVSGAMADSSEKGRIMWARVKGRAENALSRLPFRGVYHFRPGLMQPMAGQRNVVGHYRLIATLYPLVRRFWPSQACTLREVAQAMIACTRHGNPSTRLEMSEIQRLAQTV